MSERSPPLYSPCGNTIQNSKNKNNVVHLSSNMVVIIYCYIDYKDKATTWYLNGFPEGSKLKRTLTSARASPLRVLGFLRRSALRRWSRSVSRPFKDSYDSVGQWVSLR